MKRDPRLATLSSEHHQALVLARRVEARASAGSADASLAKEVAESFVRELEPHFQLEEAVLLPALRAVGQQALVSKTEIEHAALRAEARSAGTGSTSSLGTFAARLSDHVRFEERELFPCCETALPSEVLDEVARRSQAAHRRRRDLGARDAHGCRRFIREHRDIERLLDLLEGQLDALRSETTPDCPLMMEVLLYLTSYVDRYHHHREDLAFRKAERRAPELASSMAIGLREHELVIRSGATLLDGLERVAMDLPVSKAQVLDAARAYTGGLRAHLQYEETELFPRVDEVLTLDDWRAIETEMGPSDDPLFGAVAHEDYRLLVERLGTRSEIT